MLTERGRALLERWVYLPVKVGDDFVVPYTDERWIQVLRQGGYGAEFEPFLARVQTALAEPGWPAGSYYAGGWFRALQAAGAAPERATIEPDALRRYFQDEVRVDAKGRWFVGKKAVESRVLEHFLRHLQFDAELGRYRIHYRLEHSFESRYLRHLSPPIRVRRLTLEAGTPWLWLNTGHREPLRAESLRLDAAEQLYCAVGEDELPAWFEEPARWELLKDLDERDGAWVVSVGGRELAAPLDAPWPYADGLPDDLSPA